MAFVRSDGAVIEANRGPTITAPRPSSINSFTGLTRAYEAIYASQPNVRTVVSFLGKNIAQLQPRLLRRVSADERSEEYDHPLAKLARLPNPLLSRFMFMRELVEDIGIYDVFVGVKANVGDRRVVLRIPPQYVEPIGDNWLFPDGFRILGSRTRPELARADVVFLRGYNPGNPRWGLSPIETLRQLLAEDEAAGEYREQLWLRGARGSGYITRPPDAPEWSETARERFRQSFEALYAGNGPGAGGTPILEEGMTYEAAGFTADEAQYLEARKLTREEVAGAYHLDPASLGMRETADNAGDSAHRRLYQDNLGPWCQWIAEELTLQLLPDFDGLDALDELSLILDIEDKLKGDFATEAEAASRAVGAPWRTRNEQRARFGLKPLDGGDELITPLNVTVGGRASPADTAPGTPGAGQLRRPRALRALPRSSAKADTDDDTVDPVDNLVPEARGYVDVIETSVLELLDRQAASVLSKLGAGDTPVEAFGLNADGRMARWDGELTDALAGVALAMAPDAAAPVAEAFDLDFDLELATAYLLNNARIAAETFNEKTYADVAALWPAPTSRSRRRKAGEEELAEDAPVIADAFTTATSRARSFAVDRSAHVANFARGEAATQAGATTKTWTTPSPHPRATHGALNGVTIGIAERFSNGAARPHDPALPVGESAGCTCHLTYTETPRDEDLAATP